MARTSELPLSTRLFLAAYRWRRVDPVPWTPLRKPLAQCRVALVTTGGMFGPGQKPFDRELRGGDYSFREIPNDVDAATLIDSHRSEAFDHAGIRSDANLAFPIDRLRELEREGVIGSLNRRHLSYMGSITAPGRLIAESAPDGAARLAEDEVDAVLLVPV